MLRSTVAPHSFDNRAVVFAGLRLHPVTVDEVLQALAERAPEAPFAVFTTPNMEHVHLARRRPDFAWVNATSWLSSNDSRILRLAGWLAGLKLRFAPGAYVISRLFREVIAPDDRLTIVGGAPDLIEELKAKFGLTAVAHHNPPMGFIGMPEAVAAASDFVAQHPARFVFIAMGPPQSELLCGEILKRGVAQGVGLCIGSSLAVLVGRTDPAPDWMEHSGLVWLYRLVREPKRLWRRYLLRGGDAILLCARAILGRWLGRREG